MDILIPPYDPLGIMQLTSHINALIKQGLSREAIQANVRQVMKDNLHVASFPPRTRQHIVSHAFARAQPFDAREARARAKKRAYKEAQEAQRLARKHRTSTAAYDRRSLLASMKDRGETGYPVDRQGFPPYHPSGADLVGKGFAILKRHPRGGNCNLSMLHITPAGLAYLEQAEKRAQKQRAKYAQNPIPTKTSKCLA